jgi:hypothetical protein
MQAEKSAGFSFRRKDTIFIIPELEAAVLIALKPYTFSGAIDPIIVRLSI